MAMHIINIIAFFVLFCSVSYGQNASGGNKSKKKKTTSTESQLDSIFQYTLNTHRQLSTDSLIILETQLGQLSQEINNTDASLKHALIQVLLKRRSEAPLEIIELLTPLIASYEAEDQLKGYAYSALSFAYYNIGDYKNTLKYAQEEKRILNVLPSPSTRSVVNNNHTLAVCYMYLGDYQAAERSVNEGIAWLKNQKQEQNDVMLLLQATKSSMLADQQKYDEAIASGKQTIELFLKVPADTILSKDLIINLVDNNFSLEYLGNLYGNIATNLLSLQQYDEAAYFLPNLELFAQINKSKHLSSRRNFLEGMIAFHKQQYQQSIYYCSLAQKEAEAGLFLTEQINSLQCLCRAQAASGDHEAAFNNLEKYNIIQDSIINEDKLRELERQRYQHQLEVRELELQKQHELQQQQLKQQRQLLVFLGIILLFVLGSVSFLLRVNRNKTALNKQLSKLNKRIEQMIHSVSHDMMGSIELAISGAMLADISRESSINEKSIGIIRSSLKSLKEYALRLLQSPFVTDYLTPGNTDTMTILDEIIQMFKVNINNKSVRIKRLPLPYIQLPDYVVRQLFHNLMTNTLTHGIPKTGISKILVYAQQVEGQSPQIIWENNGPSLTEEQCKQIFNVQPSNPSSTHGRGLSLLKNTLESYGYTIWAASDKEKEGVQFLIKKEE